MLDKKYNLISGYALNRCDLPVKILSVCTPSRLVKNTSEQVIKKIYKSTLDIHDKKFIVNKIIGLTGKKYNKREKTSIFLDRDEAYIFTEDKHSLSTIVYFIAREGADPVVLHALQISFTKFDTTSV